ncbi:MAG: HlyD family efflux transporter periplasmic adaptor subunit [Acidobacteria bacterium]|nr:HlyD family efflux transporter periplasmic adaptor subunit [Acidobacteriota bacterium]
MGLLVLGAVGYMLWQRQAAQQETAQVARAVTRTATVSVGKVQQTIRLTGVTAAENFVSLVTPQLRGSRGSSGGSGGSGGGGSRGGGSSSGGGGAFNASMAGTTQVERTGMGALRATSSGGASGGGQGGSSGGSGASGGSGGSGGGAGASVSSTGGGSTPGGGGSGAAFKSATSRVQKDSKGSGKSSMKSAANSGESVVGADGIGSTSGQLSGGGGGMSSGGGGGGSGGSMGGGGFSEFMLVLQNTAKPGSRVKKGDMVAEFDRQYMLNRLDDYRASVAQTEASLKKFRSEIAIYREMHAQAIRTSEAELEKAKLDLKTLPVLSAIDSERVRLALEEAQARHKQILGEVKEVEKSFTAQTKNAELQFRQSQLELKRYEANADRMVAKAPIDGLVVMQNTFRGSEMAQIQEGDQLYPGQFYMQIVDTSSMVINATMNQVDSERLRVGMRARVRFDAYPDLELPAHIYGIGAVTKSGGFRASFFKEVPLRLKIDKMDPRVIPDLSVSIDVVLDESSEQASMVPSESVFKDEAGKSFVFVKQGEAWIRRDIELGMQSYIVAAVKSGLKQGEVVALERPPVPAKSS